MRRRAGVELTATRLRAVLAGPWRDVPVRTLDVAWNPTQPLEGVAALRSALGTVESVSLAVGLGLLHVKRLELPAAGDVEREQMVALDGERFFAASEAIVSALAPGSDVGFAVHAADLDAWRAAFAAWAPVVRVEPAPTALARAMDPARTGEYRVDAGPDDHGVVSISAGSVTGARRVPVVMGEPSASPLPAVRGVAGEWGAALGALLGADEGESGTLASDDERARMRNRRRRRLVTSAATALVAILFAGWGFDVYRQRTLDALVAEAVAFRPQAEPGAQALAARGHLDAELAQLRRGAVERGGALAPLAALSGLLPGDAVVLSAQATGHEWQVDGTASDAAALVPILDRDPRFQNVRTLSASSRFRDGTRTRETFSIAFRVKPGN
ncbi:MAG: hypothetical protein ABIZ91_07375 [Gemmatimonadaceae bacterium]